MTQHGRQTILFVGSGDLAARTAAALRVPARCLGLCRHPRQLPSALEGLSGDYTRDDGFAALSSLRPDTVVLTLKPDGRDTDAYQRGFLLPTQRLLAALGEHRPCRVLFVSSTRVYAESDGGWVDESAPLAQGQSPAAMIAEAERVLLASAHPATILRCAGLYGAGDGMLPARIRRGELSPESPLRYGNRVHREDAAGFIAWLIEQECKGRQILDCYNVVDDDPAPQHEVDRWLASAMAVTAPKVPKASSARDLRGHKRVSNHRLRASGYVLQYPDFRSGYAAALGLDHVGAPTC